MVHAQLGAMVLVETRTLCVQVEVAAPLGGMAMQAAQIQTVMVPVPLVVLGGLVPRTNCAMKPAHLVSSVLREALSALAVPLDTFQTNQGDVIVSNVQRDNSSG
jgi:hypothetical protein